MSEKEALEALQEELDKKEGYKVKLQYLADAKRDGELEPAGSGANRVIENLRREAFSQIRQEAEAKETTAQSLWHLRRERDDLELLYDWMPVGNAGPIKYFGIVGVLLAKLEELIAVWEQREEEERKLKAPAGQSKSKRQPPIEPFRWHKSERQLVYLFEQLIARGYLSEAWEGEKLWAKVSAAFVDKRGNPLDNKQLAQQKQNYLRNKTGRPRGAGEIDQILSEEEKRGDDVSG